MKEIFDTYVETTFEGNGQAEFKFKQFECNYRSYFPHNRSNKMLDIGIGRGEMLTCMSQWGYEDHLGIDISPSTVKFCTSIGLNCIHVAETVEWLKGGKNVFSVITLIDVLEHIEKEKTLTFLKAVKSSLKKGGIVIIQVPNLQAPDGQLHRYNDFTHEVGYIEHSLRQVLLAAGFEDIIFGGFEEFVFGGVREGIKKLLRRIYWKYSKLTRIITGNLNPEILNPVFFAVVRNK